MRMLTLRVIEVSHALSFSTRAFRDSISVIRDSMVVIAVFFKKQEKTVCDYHFLINYTDLQIFLKQLESVYMVYVFFHLWFHGIINRVPDIFLRRSPRSSAQEMATLNDKYRLHSWIPSTSIIQNYHSTHSFLLDELFPVYSSLSLSRHFPLPDTLKESDELFWVYSAQWLNYWKSGENVNEEYSYKN